MGRPAVGQKLSVANDRCEAPCPTRLQLALEVRTVYGKYRIRTKEDAGPCGTSPGPRHRGRRRQRHFFVGHHLEEKSKGYWQEKLATATPDVAAVIELLVFRSSWGTNDLESFDFTLPGDVTNYVASVHFDEAGEIDGIDMES